MSDPEEETTPGWLGGVAVIVVILLCLFVVGVLVRAL
jgi:hypothetical protein